MFVVESSGEAPIPLRPEAITAFIGPTPRGPAGLAVQVGSTAEFRARFGSPLERSRMEAILGHYFANGGRKAVVVRAAGSASGRLVLPGPGGDLVLAAVNPGHLEFLRAAVDWEGIPDHELWRFNLIVQRVRSPAEPLVEAQEIWPAVSVAPDDSRFVGDALAASTLVRISGDVPPARPAPTAMDGAGRPRYVQGQVPAGLPLATDYDLVGSRQGGTGLHALDAVPVIDTVCLLSPGPAVDVGPVALFAAARYCEQRHALLIIDPPQHWRSVADVVRSRRERGFTSPDVLTCYPMLLDDAGHPVSAMGAVAGLLAQQDRQAPATTAPVLRIPARLAERIDRTAAAALVRSGVNALLPGRPGEVALAGGVTLAGDSAPEWRQLQCRRLTLRIAGALARGTRWAGVQSGERAWRDLAKQVCSYLSGLSAQGLLAPGGPSYYVKCDADTNRQGPGVAFVVGLALSAPGDFIALGFRQTPDGCQVNHVGWQPGLALAG